MDPREKSCRGCFDSSEDVGGLGSRSLPTGGGGGTEPGTGETAGHAAHPPFLLIRSLSHLRRELSLGPTEICLGPI